MEACASAGFYSITVTVDKMGQVFLCHSKLWTPSKEARDLKKLVGESAIN